MKRAGEMIWFFSALMFFFCLAHDVGVYLIHGANAVYWINWK